MKGNILIAVLVLVGIAVGVFVWYNQESVKLPSGEPETTVTQTKPDGTTQEVMITDGTKHNVPLDEIVGGGPPKDGIPSVDKPKFISPQEASDWFNDEEPGIAFSRGDTRRFYPFQILVHHEIVNDRVPSTGSGQGRRVLVTYCPLCLSGVVFDPLVNGERVEFGVSGKLWNSNLVMYDRKTDSLWSQILGEAIVGPQTGTELEVLPSDQMRFGDWKREFPDGEVLSRDTGARKFYGTDPYGNYYSDNDRIISQVNNRDDRLENKELILGVVINEKAKAYHPPAIKKKGEVVDEFAGRTLVLRYNQELDAVRVFERKEDGGLERINPIPNFWFSWVAVHPETELYR